MRKAAYATLVTPVFPRNRCRSILRPAERTGAVLLYSWFAFGVTLQELREWCDLTRVPGKEEKTKE